MIHAFDNCPRLATKNERAIGKAMLEMCRKEGHVASFVVRRAHTEVKASNNIRSKIAAALEDGHLMWREMCGVIDEKPGSIRRALSRMQKDGDIIGHFPNGPKMAAIWELNPRQSGASVPAAPEHEKGNVPTVFGKGVEPCQQEPVACPGHRLTGAK